MNAHGDFSRQSFLGARSTEILREARVAIVGLGGGGSHIGQQLAHLGVGNIRLIDPDVIESSNLNRLVGGMQADVERKLEKVQIAERLIKGIRPWCDVDSAHSSWQEADHLLRDAHVVFGALDGYRQRMNLNEVAHRFCLPHIDIGMDVVSLVNGGYSVSGQMIMTLPDGPCMKCLGFITNERLNIEENRYGDAGINPQVVWTNGMLASLAVGQFVKLISPWFKSEQGYEWLELDGNKQLVTASQQPQYFIQGPCKHFTSADQGDPFFNIRKVKFASTK